MTNQEQALVDLAQLLGRQGVGYMVIGGLAAAAELATLLERPEIAERWAMWKKETGG